MLTSVIFVYILKKVLKNQIIEPYSHFTLYPPPKKKKKKKIIEIELPTKLEKAYGAIFRVFLGAIFRVGINKIEPFIYHSLHFAYESLGLVFIEIG